MGLWEDALRRVAGNAPLASHRKSPYRLNESGANLMVAPPSVEKVSPYFCSGTTTIVSPGLPDCPFSPGAPGGPWGPGTATTAPGTATAGPGVPGGPAGPGAPAGPGVVTTTGDAGVLAGLQALKAAAPTKVESRREIFIVVLMLVVNTDPTLAGLAALLCAMDHCALAGPDLAGRSGQAPLR